MAARKTSPKRPATKATKAPKAPKATKSTKVMKGLIRPDSSPETVYLRPSGCRSRMADSALASLERAVHLPGHYSEIAEQHGSGVVRRKNLNFDEGLLDPARVALGVRTETEAVGLGLSAAIEVVDFQTSMLDGFDRLMTSGGFTHDQDEERDCSAFMSGSSTP